MDMKKDRKIPTCGILPETTGKRMVVGTKQLRKALESGKTTEVFLARDADPALTEPIEQLCRQKGIQPSWVKSKSELGKACGIDVGVAAAAAIE